MTVAVCRTGTSVGGWTVRITNSSIQTRIRDTWVANRRGRWCSGRGCSGCHRCRCCSFKQATKMWSIIKFIKSILNGRYILVVVVDVVVVEVVVGVVVVVVVVVLVVVVGVVQYWQFDLCFKNEQ